MRVPESISVAAARQIAEWLDSLTPDTEDAFDSLFDVDSEFLDDEDDEEPRVDIRAELGDLDEALALSADGTDWCLIIRLDRWYWKSTLRDEQVIVVDAAGDWRVTTIGDLRATRDMVLGCSAALHCNGDVDVDDLPFRFGGNSWAGTTEDSAYGESEWMITVNGAEQTFDLRRVDLDFGGSIHAPSGTWLSIGCDGVSMSTGEIGTDIFVSPEGGLFVYQWGCSDTFHGLAEPDLSPTAAIELSDPEGLGFSAVTTISSDVLDRSQMREAVALIHQKDINPLPLDVISVSCRGWSGTATALLA